MAITTDKLTHLVDEICLGIDQMNTASAMNYCSNFTDLNTFFDTFFKIRPELESLCGLDSKADNIEVMPDYLENSKEAFGQNLWAMLVMQAGYIYIREKSFLPILDILVTAALSSNSPPSLKMITLRMHKMLGINPCKDLAEDAGLHLQDGDMARLQASVDSYQARHNKLPERLQDALTPEDRQLVSRLLLPLTLDDNTGEVLTEELLRRRYLGSRRQNHMGVVKRFSPEAFENPSN